MGFSLQSRGTIIFWGATFVLLLAISALSVRMTSLTGQGGEEADPCASCGPEQECDEQGCFTPACDDNSGTSIPGCPQDLFNCRDGVCKNIGSRDAYCGFEPSYCELGKCDGKGGCWECILDVECDPIDACEEGKCVNHGCVYSDKECDDGNRCTIDDCDTRSGCYHLPCSAMEVENDCGVGACDAVRGCVEVPKNTSDDCVCSDPDSQDYCGKGDPNSPDNGNGNFPGYICCNPGACGTAANGDAICTSGSDGGDSGTGTDDGGTNGMGGLGGNDVGGVGGGTNGGNGGGSNGSLTTGGSAGSSGSDCTAILILYGCPCDTNGDGIADTVCEWGACDTPPTNCVGGSSKGSTGSKSQSSDGSNGSNGSQGSSGSASSCATSSSGPCCPDPEPSFVDHESCAFGTHCCSDGTWDCAQNVQTGDPNAACTRKGKGTSGAICPPPGANACGSASSDGSASSGDSGSSGSSSASLQSGASSALSSTASLSSTSSLSSSSFSSAFLQGGICCTGGSCTIGQCEEPFESTDECDAVCGASASSSSTVIVLHSSLQVSVASSSLSSTFGMSASSFSAASLSLTGASSQTNIVRPEEDDDGDRDNDDGIVDNEGPSLVAGEETPDIYLRTDERAFVAAASICGNGLLDASEECDDQNRRDGDGCTATCLLEIGICGDGIIQKLLGEQCEQATHNPALPYDCIGCLTASRSCGDGAIDPGEECDDGGGNSLRSDAYCRPDCHGYRCGDGIIDSAEQCDDGNRRNGDDCDIYCRVEEGEPGVTVIASEQQDNEIPYALPPTPNSQSFPFPQYPVFGQFPMQLPFAQLQPLTQAPATAQTGPAAIAVIGAGAAAGFGWMRRRRK